MNFAMAEMKVAVAMILKRYVLLTLFCLPIMRDGGGIPYKEDEGSRQIFWKHGIPEMYQDPVLWTWLELYFTPKNYQF